MRTFAEFLVVRDEDLLIQLWEERLQNEGLFNLKQHILNLIKVFKHSKGADKDEALSDLQNATNAKDILELGADFVNFVRNFIANATIGIGSLTGTGDMSQSPTSPVNDRPAMTATINPGVKASATRQNYGPSYHKAIEIPSPPEDNIPTATGPDPYDDLTGAYAVTKNPYNNKEDDDSGAVTSDSGTQQPASRSDIWGVGRGLSPEAIEKAEKAEQELLKAGRQLPFGASSPTLNKGKNRVAQ